MRIVKKEELIINYNLIKMDRFFTVPGLLLRRLNGITFTLLFFLIHYNHGYSTTLDDIASKFKFLQNPTANSPGADPNIDVIDSAGNATLDGAATICCKDRDTCATSLNDDQNTCTSNCTRPIYSLDLTAITLLIINQTADKILSRIIPQPGSDCKLIDSDQFTQFPDYDLTVIGLPVSIACNLSASLNVGGVAVPIPASTPASTPPAQTPALSSAANTATDGVSGHEVAAPPPAWFSASITSTNSLTLQASGGGGLSLPPGTYKSQKGRFGPKSQTLFIMVTL